MKTQLPMLETDLAHVSNIDEGSTQVLPDLAYKRLGIVNIMMVGLPDSGDRDWILIDAGLLGTATAIKKAAEARFGNGSRPAAIILTHGHFDHVGALQTLADEWNVRVYAHVEELDFLNGSRSYPPPDPTVGGLMALASPLFPRGPVNVRHWLRPLPEDGTVPGLPDWQWIASPGHTPGHISFWRESDRTLISGDSVITTRQESAYSVAVQEPELHGPPMYFTPDWTRARESVRRLADLKPEIMVAGHGAPLRGENLRAGLFYLGEKFNDLAVPKHARKV